MSDAIQEGIGYKATYQFTALTGGVHTGMDPKHLQMSQYARGINLTTRGGSAKTRPAFQLTSMLGYGKFQGSGVLSLDDGDRFVYAIDGKLYWIDNGVAKLIAGTLSATIETVYFTQVYRWLVAQDGVSRPVVIEEVDGQLVRLARDTVLEPTSSDTRICLVPGTIGVYAHGRFHYVPALNPLMEPVLEETEDKSAYTDASLNAVPLPSDESGRTGFVSSDILDSLNPYKVFQMSEHRSLDEGGMFSLPAEHGFVYGMKTLRGASNGTGVGALIVFGSKGVSGFDVGLPRSSSDITGGKGWKDLSFSQSLFTGAGTRSPFSIVNINDDLWYCGVDKHLRSISYDVTQFSSAGQSSALSNTSKSFEAQRWVDRTSDSYRQHISAAVADNRLHWNFCDGKAIGSLDFAQVYTANPSDMPVVHEGIWTGFDFRKVLELDGKLHFVASSRGSHYLLTTGGDKDLGVTPITSELVTPEVAMIYNEVHTRTWTKKLTMVEMNVSGLTQPTELSVYFRPSTYPEWTLLGTRSFFVPEGTPPQSRVGVQFLPDYSTASACNPVDHSSLYCSTYFQFKIVWTGRATIDSFVAYAQRIQDPPEWVCGSDNAEGVAFPVDSDDDFAYAVQIGGPT